MDDTTSERPDINIFTCFQAKKSPKLEIKAENSSSYKTSHTFTIRHFPVFEIWAWDDIIGPKLATKMLFMWFNIV